MATLGAMQAYEEGALLTKMRSHHFVLRSAFMLQVLLTEASLPKQCVHRMTTALFMCFSFEEAIHLASGPLNLEPRLSFPEEIQVRKKGNKLTNLM